jgi:hypothetical protein
MMMQRTVTVGVLALFCAVVPARAQAKPLDSLDFVVAGVPDSYPYLDVSDDTAAIHQILGAPQHIERVAGYGDDSVTTWQYDGLSVDFGSIARWGMTVTSPRYATRRGLHVGDPSQRLLELYGSPANIQDNEWTYEDPREHLHVMIVTVEHDRVTRVYFGTLWD